MKRLGALISTVFVSFSTANASDLGTEVAKCFAGVTPSAKRCESGKQCSARNAATFLGQCLTKKNLTGVLSCDFEEGGLLKCSMPVSEKLFPDSSNCELRLALNGNGVTAEVGSDSQKKCMVGRYDLKAWPIGVGNAIQSPDGRWLIPKPVVSNEFEKVVRPEDIDIESFVTSGGALWEIEGNADFCREQVMNIIDNSSATAAVKQLVMAHFGLPESGSALAKRHFSGRQDPPSSFIVTNFKLKKSVDICGVTVPIGTELNTRFGRFSCVSGADGALEIGGLPRAAFPAITNQNGDAKYVSCVPSAAGKISNVGRMLTKGAEAISSLPKLDWQKCDCRLSNSSDE